MYVYVLTPYPEGIFATVQYFLGDFGQEEGLLPTCEIKLLTPTLGKLTPSNQRPRVGDKSRR